jgi:hypothetical protein
MDRRTALIVTLAVALVSVGAWAKSKSPSKAASSQPGLTLQSIDRAQRLIHVELRGYKKAPAGNLFSMTDDRGRHYIAQTVRCTPAAPNLSCALEIPDGYERHPLVSLELHVRGLHSRTIAVPADVVAAAWQASLSPPDGGAPDAAPAKPAAPATP